MIRELTRDVDPVRMVLMITQVTENLAKLLSQENIYVRQENRETASFDLKNRILYIPFWENLSDVEVELLVGHEIGHALYTNTEAWLSSIEKFDGSKNVFKHCLNVVEDARIERLVKSRYPGMKKIFFYGYSKIVQRPGFHISQSELHSMNTVDFINAYFKFSGILSFSGMRPELENMISRIETVKTIEDGIVIAKELYKLAKEEYDERKNDPSRGNFEKYILTFSDGDEGEDGDKNSEKMRFSFSFDDKKEGESNSSDQDTKSGNAGSDSSDKEGSEKSNENKSGVDSKAGSGSNSDSDSASESDDSEGDSAAGDKDGEDGEDSDEDSEQDGDGEDEDEDEDDLEDFENSSTNGDDIVERLSRENSTTKETEMIYLETPEPVLSKILVSYKQIIKVMEDHKHDLSRAKDSISGYYRRYFRTIEYSAYTKKHKPVVDQFTQIFEMKKKATEYNRTLNFRSGILDPNKLYNSKCDDHIFKTFQVRKAGKNHGLVMFLDLSSSMNTIMTNVLEQMFELVFFCRQANIPYVVYGFSNCAYFNGGLYDGLHGNAVDPAEQFKHNPSMEYSLSPTSLALLELSSSAMSLIDFKKMFNFCFSHIGTTVSLSSTPLIQTTMALESIVNKFRSETRVEKVNVVYLTDGQSDCLDAVKTEFVMMTRSQRNSAYYDYSGRGYAPLIKGSDEKKMCVLVDKKTRKQYAFDYHERCSLVSKNSYSVIVHETLLRVMKGRLGPSVNIMNFFITSSPSTGDYRYITDSIGTESEKAIAGASAPDPYKADKFYWNLTEKERKQRDAFQTVIGAIADRFSQTDLYAVHEDVWGFDEVYFVHKNAFSKDSAPVTQSDWKKQFKSITEFDDVKKTFSFGINRKKRMATMVNSFIDRIA